MDNYIRQSIDARKNAFSASFEISAKMQEKINSLFVEIEKLGEKCKDVGEFEAEFSKSPLNQQYMDLFTEIASKTTVRTAAKSAMKGAAENVARQALRGTIPTTRAAVHQKAYDEVRKVPGLGDAIDVSEKVGYAMHLGKLFGKRKKEKDGKD